MPDPVRYSALIYIGISLAVAAIFLLATFATGFFYPPVARLGGAGWVFILSMIITMPLVIPYVKKKRNT
ncbi:MAG: hypothetical protein C4589_02570 [Peptococcaceae bacterium]|nr:MAG: hypothetical protein C4589_02570 [Peptococcaceae bacterium]